MINNTIRDILSAYAKNFNANIMKLLTFSTAPEMKGVEAMVYATTNGGKRIRPFLLTETAKLFGVDFDVSFFTAAALEMIHTYSLIHDDLPAMDDDVLRRGKATCHIKFDEATAILAGDGLLTYAFEVLSSDINPISLDKKCFLINHLAKSAGAFDGMVAGQVLDLYAENLPAHEQASDLIKRIEEMKTGRLISYACFAGSVLGDASIAEKDALHRYSRNIGIAFQIADDILDATGDEAIVGKSLNKDKEQGKVTFVTIYGLEKAKETAQKLIDDAVASLAIFGDKASNLVKLAQYIVDRTY